MPYVRRQRRDSASVLAPFLLALGSLGVLALVWRRRAAPRAEQRSTAGDGAHEASPALIAWPTNQAVPGLQPVEIQPATTGAGPLIHRRYEVHIPLEGLHPADLLRLMQRHLSELAPSALADFTKATGTELAFRVGDEYDITMLGPWNGRVRVAEVTTKQFTLVTLDGHPESGHITFSAMYQHGRQDAAVVLIESWARARDAVVEAAYSTIRIGKQVQAEVWITFLQRLAALAGVTPAPQVRIVTEELPAPDPAAVTTADEH
jgi:Domain of unknown function (DUF1990)